VKDEQARTITEEVLVVAAGNAWPFYRLTNAYVCQAGRFFRPVRRIAFYSNKTIHGVAATIERELDDQMLSDAAAARLSNSLVPAERRLGNTIAAALAGAWKEGERAKVLFLTGVGDPATATFPAIPHRGKSAWTMGQRYAPLDLLAAATTTEDLTREASGADPS